MVTVGGGSTFTVSNALDIGNSGTGILEALGKGAIFSGAASIGHLAGSNGQVLVTGLGSGWLVSGVLEVGDAGTGSLVVADGGSVVSSAGNVGNQAGSSGTVDINNAEWKLDGDLMVGADGSGTVTVENLGMLVDVNADVGGAAGAEGMVVLDDGVWFNSGSLDIGVGGAGEVTIENKGQLTAGDTTVGGEGSLMVDPAIVDVDGDFTLDAGGLLTLDIAGDDPGSVSQLDITGSGTFDGTIDIDFIGGFTPQTGQTFVLIDAAGGADLSGATIAVEGLAPGFEYSESFGNGEFTLTALNDGASPTPEPDAAWLLSGALGLLLAGAAVKKRRAIRYSSKLSLRDEHRETNTDSASF